MKKKTALASLALLIASTVHARPPLKDEKFKVFSKGRPVGTIHMTDTNQKGDILLINDSGGTVNLTDGTKRTFKAGARHVFTSDWKWKSSEVTMPLAKEPVKVTVENAAVRIDMNFGGKKSVRSHEYKGRVFPRRAFYTYLRTIQPPPKMEANEVYLFNEMNLTVQKVTWTYLGIERNAKGKLNKYEIKGLDTVLTIDDKMNIQRVIELDVGLELVKN